MTCRTWSSNRKRWSSPCVVPLASVCAMPRRSLPCSESDTLLPTAHIQDNPLTVDLVHPNGDMVSRSMPLQFLDACLAGLRVVWGIGVIQFDPELAARTVRHRVFEVLIWLPQASNHR